MEDQTLTPLQLAARDALDIHNASNLSGVLQSWARHQRALMDACNGNSSDAYRQHPVNLLFLSKVTSLMRINADALGGIDKGTGDLYRWADDECRALLR